MTLKIDFAFEEGKKKQAFIETFLEGSWRDEGKGPGIDASICFHLGSRVSSIRKRGFGFEVKR